MKVSVCVTTLNEEESIVKLLDSLIGQSQKVDEIVIVDGGSVDRTIEIINHYQKRFRYIKLLKEKCSRARGRNLGVEIARNEIIAMTDAGCVAERDWLKNLTEPFETGKVDVSAGFYRMTGSNPVQKAMAIFLGVMPSKFDAAFLPSTRSIAFRKQVWEEIGGFPDEEKNSAEDTYFNYAALKLGMKYARVKDAVVEWGMPESASQFMSKIKEYAKWDAKTRILFFPGKGLASHNIKAFSVLFRYLIGLILLILSLGRPSLFAYLFIFLFAYLTWAFRKVYLEYRDIKISLWGPILQIVSDFGVMRGFIEGIFS